MIAVAVPDAPEGVFVAQQQQDVGPVVYLRVSGTDGAETVTRGYRLHRFQTGAAAQGNYPIKFNGSLFQTDER